MADYNLNLGIESTALFDELQRIKNAVTELQTAAKQSGTTITQSLTEAANASKEVASQTVKVTGQLGIEAKAAGEASTQFKGMLDSISKISGLSTKSFDPSQLLKFNSTLKDTRNSLIDIATKQTNAFDKAKVAELGFALQGTKDDAQQLALVIDFIEKNLGDLNIDPTQTEGLQNSITTLKTLFEQTGIAGKKAFTDIGGSASNLQTVLQTIETEAGKAEINFNELKTAIDAGKVALQQLPAGSDQFNTLSAAIENATAKLNAEAQSLDQLKIKLSNLTISVGAETDVQQIAALNQEIDQTKAAIDRLQNAGKEGFDNLGNKIGTTSDRATTLTTRIRAITNELAGMQKGTPQFNALINEAARLTDELGDTRQQIQLLASDTSHLDAGIQAVQGLVGVFAAAQGAVALFGDQNEELQKTLLKVNAAMALLQGLQQVGQILDKNSALNVFLMKTFRLQDVVATEAQVLAQQEYNAALIEQAVLTGGLTAEQAALAVADVALAGAEETATVAQAGLNVAMLSNPAGLLLLAFAALAGGLLLYQSRMNSTLAVQNAFAEAQKKAADAIAKEEGELNILLATAKDDNLSRSERQDAIDKIKASYPEYLHNLSLENLYTKQSSDLIEEEIDLLKKRALVQASQDVYIEKLKAVAVAEAEVNRIRSGGITLGDKLRGFFLETSGNAINLTADELALEHAIKNVNDANIEAGGAFEVVNSARDNFSKGLQTDIGVLQNYIHQFDLFREASSQPLAPLSPVVKPFDPKQFDADKKAALDLAQYQVDVATKGTIDEINARKALLIKQHEFEIEDKRLTDDQKKALQGKFISDIADIDSQLRQKQLQDASAVAQARIILAKEGTKEQLDAQLDAIDVETRAQISAVGIQQGEILRILSDAEKKKQELRRTFYVQELQNEVSLQNAIVDTAIEGSEQEYFAKRKLLELNAAIEISNAKENAARIKEINAKLNHDLFELYKSTNKQIALLRVNVQIDDIDARLAAVEKGSIEELNLIKERNDKETELALIQLVNSNKNETEIQAERNKVIAEGNARNLEADKTFFQQRIDAALAFQKSVLAIQNAEQQNIIDDPFSTNRERRDAQKQILQNELQDLFNQRAAITQAFLQGLIPDRQKYETAINNIIAEETKKRKELEEAALPEPFDLTRFLGNLVGLTDEQTHQILDSFGSLFDGLNSLAEANAQKQIDAIDEIIDKLDEQIDAQQKVVDEQKNLSDSGRANELRNQQKVLDDLKAKKEAEVQAREEAQKRMEAIQKREAIIQSASIVASTVETEVDLISAAAKAFKATAGIPFVGIALGIAAAVSLVAAFLQIKASMQKAVQDIPKLRHGGTIDTEGEVLKGPSHQERGLGLYNEKTGKRVAEFEGREYLSVFNKESTQKHHELIRDFTYAINKDMLPTTNFEAIHTILHDGRMPMERIERIVILQKEVEHIKLQKENGNKKELIELRDEVSKFRKEFGNQYKGKVIRIDMGEYWLERENGRTRKIYKRKTS